MTLMQVVIIKTFHIQPTLKLKKEKDNIKESFKLPVDYSKIPIEIVKSIYNPLKDNKVKYFYPIDKQDIYDVSKIINHNKKLLNDYITSDKVRNILNEEKNKLNNKINEVSNDIFNNPNNKLTLEKIKNNVKKQNEETINSKRETMRKERKVLLDDFFKTDNPESENFYI